MPEHEIVNAAGDIALDDLDHVIISSLQEDGRRSYGQLAQAVGLSETAVRRRTQRMVDSRVIRIVAVPDTAYFRKTVGATIGVSCNGDPSEALAFVNALPQADYIVSTSGRYTFMAEVQCADNDELFDLTNRLLALSVVSGVEIHYYLKYHKQTYSWPPGSNHRQG